VFQLLGFSGVSLLVLVILRCVLPFLWRVIVIWVTYRLDKRTGDLDGLAKVLAAIRSDGWWHKRE
jgi:hypothetical protein